MSIFRDYDGDGDIDVTDLLIATATVADNLKAAFHELSGDARDVLSGDASPLVLVLTAFLWFARGLTVTCLVVLLVGLAGLAGVW